MAPWDPTKSDMEFGGFLGLFENIFFIIGVPVVTITPFIAIVGAHLVIHSKFCFVHLANLW